MQIPHFYSECDTYVAFYDNIKSQNNRSDFMQYTQRLEDLRKDKDLTQEQLAKLLDLKREQYRRYETGINEIKAGFIIKICKFYNVSADYLLGFTNEYKPLPKK